MRRPPLSGRVLTITTGPWGTSVIKREENNITIWDGIAFEYFNALAKLGNFSYVVIENNDNNIVDENGQWTGQLGLLKRGEADVAVTPFLMSEQRKKLFYFIEPELWRRETNFDVHDDGSGKVGWLGWFRYTGGVLQPFERGVWLLVALTIVVNFLLLLVVLRLSTRKGKVTNSGVIIVEHFFRLLTLKDTYLEKASVWSSSDWILTSCALFAVAITCFYCSSVQANTAILPRWNAPFSNPTTMYAAGYSFFDWFPSPYMSELQFYTKQMQITGSPEAFPMQQILNQSYFIPFTDYREQLDAYTADYKHQPPRAFVGSWPFGIEQTHSCVARPISFSLQLSPNATPIPWPRPSLAGFPIRSSIPLKLALDQSMRDLMSFGLRDAISKRISYYWDKDYGKIYLRETCHRVLLSRIRPIGFDAVALRFIDIVSALFVLGFGSCVGLMAVCVEKVIG